MISTMLLPAGQPLFSGYAPTSFMHRQPAACRQYITYKQPFSYQALNKPLLPYTLRSVTVGDVPPLFHSSTRLTRSLAHRNIEPIRPIAGWRPSLGPSYWLNQPAQDIGRRCIVTPINQITPEAWIETKRNIQVEVAQKLGLTPNVSCSWIRNVESATSGKRLFLVFDGESVLFKKKGIFSHRDIPSIPPGTEVLVAQLYRSARSTDLLGHCTQAISRLNPQTNVNFEAEVDRAVESWYENWRAHHDLVSRHFALEHRSTSAGEESVGNELLDELEDL